jgi:hypothetical protein
LKIKKEIKMGNMSYCRYRNTLNDLEDCFEAMRFDYFDQESLSNEEKHAMEQLIELCEEIAQEYEELE